MKQARQLDVAVCISIIDETAWPMATIRMDGPLLGAIGVSDGSVNDDIAVARPSAAALNA
ncbi:hypothetical protein GKA01_16010 [Gluconobacter kanchanaburiensis NBRC 103587]|uniref:Uncharacterized protein n=1 Tax=Gluconobacter kanchanaburiensis NBRC 103587 TaxID=1307948 RepID=A0A511B7T9_9PROT|nr:hypothetical protein AA103587_0875 [Gluconobacter kanchanaburiensis NBRC 103587]GEK96404.1 hypothetical protein GKA01_16010 [Gluconobacter kanchanaburiensis NBRC 103587]